ncbi:MAG: hypothetical protein K9G61_02415 [Bacteroidales bacterium]|nr:hypothetical protein [Bacteroidales bacterium]
MKKLFISSLIIFVAVFIANKLSAQNPIPSFNVPIIVDPTIFEEVVPSSSFNFNSLNLSLPQLGSREERKLHVTTVDDVYLSTAWVTIEVYSLDGAITYGSFTVYEGTLFEISLSSDSLWGVSVIGASPGSRMSVWFD